MSGPERIPRADALRAAIASTHFEGHSLHLEDLKIVEAWAHHELTLEQAFDQLLNEAASSRSSQERHTRYSCAFPTLRQAHRQCYGSKARPTLTPEMQGRLMDEQFLDSAWRIANDPQARERIKHWLF